MLARNILGLRQYTLNRLSLIKERFKLPEKWKGGRVQKWSLFWENLLLDYKNVFTDVVTGAKAKPYKSAFIASGLGVVIVAIKTNPDQHSFNDYFVQCRTALLAVGNSVKNPFSEQHIQYIARYQRQDLLRHTNLIFFSLEWVADYAKDCDIYAARCKYLQPKYSTFYQRIVDVGAFGVWWNLKRKMVNYDINPGEWEGRT